MGKVILPTRRVELSFFLAAAVGVALTVAVAAVPLGGA
jgi:hypothetical protein